MDIDFFKKEKIVAMKAHDKDTVAALNVLINKIMLATIEKRAKDQTLSDADVIGLVQKTEKELEEEKDAFEKAGRAENVVALNNQIAAINKYLPKFMSAEEIKNIIAGLEDKSVPAVMKVFKTEYAGKCDMRTVNEVLRSLK